MLVKNAFLSVVALAVVSLCGCQSWSPGGFPLQNMSRVPPPGTGTYQLPNGYYNNNTSATTPSGQVMTAGATGGLRPAQGALPTTNLAASQGNAQVQTAQFTAPAGNSPQFTGSSNSGGPTSIETPASGFPTNRYQSGGSASSSAASASFSDSEEAAADLKWQP